MDIKEILAKAFDIGNKTSFKVFFNQEQLNKTNFKELTYTELGIYLVNNSDKIKCIDITLKD